MRSKTALIQTLLCAAIIGFTGIASFQAQAQRIRLESGDLDFLKGQTTVGIKYVYEGMLVGEKQEADYVSEKTEAWNKKEAGKGDKWRAGWFADRTGRYQPKFEKVLNKILERKAIVLGSAQKDAKYTMIMRTVMTEPGWAGWGIVRKASHIDIVATFVETAKPDTTLATISVKDCPGNGLDYDPAGRIEDAYATSGKELGHFFIKRAFK